MTESSKTIIIAGTKKDSIGRVIGERLHKRGWNIWLYSRHAARVERDGWHERAMDISSEKSIQAFLRAIPRVDAAIMSADPSGHGELKDLTEKKIKEFFNAKVVGSLLLAKLLLTPTDSKPVKMIWLIGKTGVKPKNLIAYALANAALAQLSEQLNKTFTNVKAYVLPLGVISPSTMGDAYMREHPKQTFEPDSPESVAKAVEEILLGGVPAGIVPRDQSKMV